MAKERPFGGVVGRFDRTVKKGAREISRNPHSLRWLKALPCFVHSSVREVATSTAAPGPRVKRCSRLLRKEARQTQQTAAAFDLSLNS